MSRVGWYVIDTRTNEIVNCITTAAGEDAANTIAANLIDGEFLRVDRNPPAAMIERYEDWRYEG